MHENRPLPVRDELNAYYWDGAQRGELVLLRCEACGAYVHPPRELCSECRHHELVATPVSGQGTVYSWSVMHADGNPGFADRLPYVVVVVELVEQDRLLTIGNLLGATADELTIGAPVEVCFERVTDDVTLPQWALVVSRDD